MLWEEFDLPSDVGHLLVFVTLSSPRSKYLVSLFLHDFHNLQGPDWEKFTCVGSTGLMVTDDSNDVFQLKDFFGRELDYRALIFTSSRLLCY